MTTANTTKKIAIITTSTRTPRVGPSIAAWVHSILQDELDKDTDKDKNTNTNTDTDNNIHLQPLDVSDFNLPLYNEPYVIPASVPQRASFTHPHSQRWSAEISSYGGYIFVIPEYNFGIAAATKNAVDYLYNEWIGKPVMVISYGIQGGRIAGEQLAAILKGMKLQVVETRPALAFKGGVGPDAFKAMNEGVLGEETKMEWMEGEVKEMVLKGFGELRKLLF
jgi:NAD(P)H-dependent FMN reductase